MVQMMAVHLDRPECDAGYSGTLLSKDEESEPKELRMPQNINALLLCFAEQYEVMKNGIIQTGRFGGSARKVAHFGSWPSMER